MLASFCRGFHCCPVGEGSSESHGQGNRAQRLCVGWGQVGVLAGVGKEGTVLSEEGAAFLPATSLATFSSSSPSFDCFLLLTTSVAHLPACSFRPPRPSPPPLYQPV